MTAIPPRGDATMRVAIDILTTFAKPLNVTALIDPAGTSIQFLSERPFFWQDTGGSLRRFLPNTPYPLRDSLVGISEGMEVAVFNDNRYFTGTVATILEA